MIRCFRDSDGVCRAEVGGLHHLVGSFLEQDVQSGASWSRMLLGIIDEVASGTRPEFSGTGNAHHVEIRPAGVTIECIWDESLGTAVLPLDAFRECVSDWLTFLEATPAV